MKKIYRCKECLCSVSPLSAFGSYNIETKEGWLWHEWKDDDNTDRTFEYGTVVGRHSMNPMDYYVAME